MGHPGYQAVVDALSAEQPCYRMDVYALQSARLASGLKPLRTIEDIAAVFVEDIRRIQGAGPYYLGGGCEGGIVAFEVARQLQASGGQVACLFIWIVEAPQLSSKPSMRQALIRLVRQVREQFGNRQGVGLRLRDIMPLWQHEYTEYQIFRAVSRYRPDSAYQGRITVARHYLPGYPAAFQEESMGWAELATGGARVHTLPGTHDNWLSLHAGEFAQLLTETLAEGPHQAPT